jgi:hypothetical protein
MTSMIKTKAVRNYTVVIAKRILRDAAYSLQEAGFEKQHLMAALDALAEEIRSDKWDKAMASRERTRGGKRKVSDMSGDGVII